MNNNTTSANNAEQLKALIKKHPVVTGIVFILIIIVWVNILSGTSTKTETKTAEQVQTNGPQTFEDRIRELTKKNGGTELTFNSIEDTEAEKTKPKGSRMLIVKLNVISFFNANSFYRETGELTGKIFQETFLSNPNASDVIVWYYADTTDSYGNKTNKVLMSQSIDRDTYKKINWQNFDSSKMCDFLRSEGSKGNLNTVCMVSANIK